jgi:L-ascorbate metabolism protein UlaG (beta-lactamase superfamily)
MKIIKIKVSIFLLIFLLASCTAVKSTYNSFTSGVESLFSSPKEIVNKISDPYNPDAKLSVLWVGHSTTLIQIEDKFILTDPVFTDTEAMFAKRFFEPGIDAEDLPNIDLVLISHLHADHLSYGSLDMIEDKVQKLIVPDGGLVYIPDYKFDMVEVKQEHSYNFNGIEIIPTPSVHNGWRYGIDYKWMTKSYCTYIIKYKGVVIYFAGDTAYDNYIFKETGEKFTEIDLAILPISPIHPREYSKERHTDPIEALKIFRDLNAEYMLPIHYDTFPESYDRLGEAEQLLRKEMVIQNLSSNEIKILRIGEQNVFLKHD